jgi:hypothetical protein
VVIAPEAPIATFTLFPRTKYFQIAATHVSQNHPSFRPSSSEPGRLIVDTGFVWQRRFCRCASTETAQRLDAEFGRTTFFTKKKGYHTGHKSNSSISTSTCPILSTLEAPESPRPR